MGWETKIGIYISKLAARVGLKRLYRPSFDFGEVEFEAVRRPGDDLDEGAAIVYTLDVTNVGSKTAENCRPYIELHGVWEPDGVFAEVSKEGDEIEFEPDQVDFRLDEQVFWSGDVQTHNHFQEGVAEGVASKKSLAPGETGTISFVMVIGGNDEIGPTIRFPTAEGFEHSAMVDFEIDDQPYQPAVAGDEEETPDRIGFSAPVKELDRYDWNVSRIYVTSENTQIEEFHFHFIFAGDQFTIKHRSVSEEDLDAEISDES